MIGAIGLPVFSGLHMVLGFWGIVGSVVILTVMMAEVSWRVFESPLIQYGRTFAHSI